jgi:uncharacterized repeat protein (TIGR03803 family)
MTHRERDRAWNFRINPLAAVAALATACVLAVAAIPPAQAQTLTVLHIFMGEGDGSTPIAGLTQDAAGDLYGTAELGNFFDFCIPTCGAVYKVAHQGSGWITRPIYHFNGPPDGSTPTSRVIFGPDGNLYGTTIYGGTGSCNNGTVHGCGTVFKLQPPPTACPSFMCPWKETILYSFASESDGEWPQGEITFDQAGNIYGTTEAGGAPTCLCGTVFKLTHNADGSWSKSTVYAFQGGATDGGSPYAGVTLDKSGNIYGVATAGGLQCQQICGIVFELTQSVSGWTETVLHFFAGGADGADPYGGLIFDGLGNLYGAAAEGGMGVGTGMGTVYELSPGQGGWTFATLHEFTGEEADYPLSRLTMDAAGNLYGSSFSGGTFNSGTVYKLTASNGGWTYSTLYSFGANDGSTGFALYGNVVLDAAGNIYGTASQGPYPDPDSGTVFEITP